MEVETPKDPTESWKREIDGFTPDEGKILKKL